MPNRLSEESSPYLLQHKDNPVAWFPWCDEALEKSRTEDKPIFLSIGYSACHWCHVMEHESFENKEIAAYLNEHFVSIKVDREERPDLDQIYMQAVMALQRGQGGWPLSAFLTPDCHVFFGGTYWPPFDSRGMPGFKRVLQSVLDAFQNRRDQVDEQSAKVSEYLNSQSGSQESAPNDSLFSEDFLQQAGSALERVFDFQNGGFGTAPKFPHAMDLQFLMRLHQRDSRKKASSDSKPDGTENRWLKMVCLNLNKMYQGGIYDHLAGGFARYSVDAEWLVPHFEKMLYDNGLLINAYLDGYLITQDPVYEQVIRETLDYQLTYMTDEKGGFHSTEDADSEGEEGKFYVWTQEEVLSILGPDEGQLFCQVYDVTSNGNFEGKNILNLKKPMDVFADEKGIARDALHQKMLTSRSRLLEVRNQRIRPGKDDKILVSWNGLMIESMARAGAILGQDRYSTAAENAARFVLQEMTTADGNLLHSYRHGTARIDAFLDDYSYFINALITLFETKGDPNWLLGAIEMTEWVLEHFHDSENHGFYFRDQNSEKLIAQTKEYQDSSVPSGNSMMAMLLLRLGSMIGNNKYQTIARQTILQASSLLERAPTAAGQMLCALDQHLAAGEILFLFSDPEQRQEILSLISRSYSPNRLVCPLSGELHSSKIGGKNSPVEGKSMINDQPTLYVCQDYTCREPLVGLEAITVYLTNSNQTTGC